MDSFRNILFVFPVMFYYLLEAVIVAFFITILDNFFLDNIIGDVSYVQWVIIYWIFKMLFFDVFKLVTGLNMGQAMMEKENEKKNNKEIVE